jgi:hypothetical protein
VVGETLGAGWSTPDLPGVHRYRQALTGALRIAGGGQLPRYQPPKVSPKKPSIGSRLGLAEGGQAASLPQTAAPGFLEAWNQVAPAIERSVALVTLVP